MAVTYSTVVEAHDEKSFFRRDISITQFKSGLVYLLILGLIIRAGFLVEHARSPSFGVPTLDQTYYDTVAKMLLAGDDLHRLRGFRPLLYPMYVAVCYKIGGSHGIDLAVVLQHLMGVLTGFLVALMGARLFQHRLSGLLGGALYLLAGLPVYFEGELLCESSYLLMICLGLLLILRAADAACGRASVLWLLSGAMTVLTAQIRPNILVFLAVYPAFALWRWWYLRRASAWLPLLAFAGALAMGIPWGFVNKMQSGYFQIVPSTGGVNLYLGNRRAADGITMSLDRHVNYNSRYEDSVEVWAREGYLSAMSAQGRTPSPNPKAISDYWSHRALFEIKADPLSWLRLMVKKCWLTLWNREIPVLKSFTFLQGEYFWLRILPVRWVILLMLSISGVWAATKWGNRRALFVLLFFAGIYSAANILFFVVDRYRYPVWPAMAALGGGGLMSVVEILRQRQWRSAGYLGASMTLIALISLPNWFHARLPSYALDYRLRSIAWYEKGHFPEALQDIDRSVALDPADVTSLDHRGNVLLALNRFEEARQDFEQTLKVNAEDGSIWNNYGFALDALNHTNDALQVFARATRCQPPSESAFIGLSFEQIRCGNFNGAEQALQQLELINSSPNPVALALRSYLLRRRGDNAKADALERKAASLDPAATAWALQRARQSQPS